MRYSLLILVAALLLGACGHKGGLKLPKSNGAAQEQAE